MRIELFGVRGTRPTARRRGSVYGGHTPCALVRPGTEDILILDAGTGLHRLEEALRAGRKGSGAPLHFLLTHFHFDHLIGLPFFETLFRRESRLTFSSALTPGVLRRRLSEFMTGPYFPVEFSKTPARKEFRRIGSEPVDFGSVRVTACPLNHPQGCSAYRLEEGGRSVVFATDTEHEAEGVDAKLAAFALGTDILVYDATFTPAEYEAGKKGWGHSTWAAGVDLARAAGAGRLVLSHLNPDHSDEDIRRIETAARKAFPGAVCAREGMVFHLGR